MGAALGGATGAPITAVIILFELTGEYTIILPLMAAVAVAVAVSVAHLLSKDTIYTRKLLRRGVDIERAHSALPDFLAGQIAGAVPTPLTEGTSLNTAARVLARSTVGMLPVVDYDGRYHGCRHATSPRRSTAIHLREPLRRFRIYCRHSPSTPVHRRSS